MSMIGDTRYVERPHFFDGQRLFATDLQGLEAFNREMRWLHNRSLHQPGVGRGFAVSGSQGVQVVTIQPGYAIDSFGREIVLSRAHVASVPPVAGEDDGTPVFFDLTVGYPSDEDLEEAETREGICLDRGVVRLREEPIFCWVRLRKNQDGRLDAADDRLRLDVQQGRKIVLARAAVAHCRLDRALSTAERRSARPPRQPYVACGLTAVDWKIDEFTGSATTYLWADVTTSEAGFANTPCYSARVNGERPKDVRITVGDDQLTVKVIDFTSYVTNATPAGFRLLVLIQIVGVPEPATGDGVSEAAVRLRVAVDLTSFSDWRVQWMGVEG